MSQERRVELLKNEIDTLFDPLSDALGFNDLVKASLTKTTRGLVTDKADSHLWSLLPLTVCEAICGHFEHAIPVAVTLQLLRTAAEVFDDIEDADSSESLSSIYNPAIATNIATTLLILAEKEITVLKRRGVECNTVISVMETINSYYTTACAGQHMDLALTSTLDVSEDLYLKIVSLKSASHIECACYVGALIATASQELIETFATFGHNLGIAAQITNDIQGIISGIDIAKRKVTIPIIYALTTQDKNIRNQLELTYKENSELVIDTTRVKELLFKTGAIHYAVIKMELYKQRALDILSKLETTGINVEQLKRLLG
jgi:geranylgeranyl pyrophosphate synthase